MLQGYIVISRSNLDDEIILPNTNYSFGFWSLCTEQWPRSKSTNWLDITSEICM